MKIFIDTANLEEITKANEAGLIDGVTTNPTLVSREGNVDFYKHIKRICELVDGPVNAEVISLETDGMVEEGLKLASLDTNIIVKIPMTMEGLKAVKILSKKGIKTNVTLIFSANQALLAAKAGASYASPFIGRLDDAGHNGVELIEEIIKIYNNYDLNTKIITASVRGAAHVKDVALAGADIATIPYKIIQKISQHPLTDIGIERFLADWEKMR